MTPQCDDQITGYACLVKDEPIFRAQPIKAKTPGLGAGKRRDFHPPSSMNKSTRCIFHFYQSNPFNRPEPVGLRAERTFHEN